MPLDIAQLGVAALAVWLMYKIASNHINHNTQVLQELKEAIAKLIYFLSNGK